MGDIEEVVSRNVDPTLQRSYSDGSPLVSSGASGGSQGSIPLGPSPQIEGTGYRCTVCKDKVLKTKRGFLNHTFLHNVADANKRKPNISQIRPKVSGLVLTIVEEMLSESLLAEDKKNLLIEIQKCDKASISWIKFCKSISEPILKAILKKNKLLPTNQYEEVLSSVNSFFSEKENMEQLQISLSLCLPNEFKESRYSRNVIFRISFRLCEEIQILVLSEMNVINPGQSSHDNFPAVENTFASEHEKKASHDNFLKLMKAYFVRGHKINTPVYRSRCECLKRRFFESGDEDYITTEMIFDPLTWKEDKIKLSELSFDFFVKLENNIKSCLQDKGDDLRQRILDKVVQDQQASMLNAWHSLTFSFFSEADSLVFMRETILMVIDVSVLLEEKKIKRLAEEQKKLQKFALRPAMKNN